MRLAAVTAVLLAAAAGCTPATRTPADAGVDRAGVVTAGLQAAIQVEGKPAPKMSLADRMAHYHIPGVSIAVVDSGRIVWASGFGVKQAGSNDSVTPTTLFQSASISKPVTATALLKLVEEGRLALDENVNTYLKSWHLPDNQFTATEKVTLRRLVSHTAGLTVHGFAGYSTTDTLPSVQQILDGKRPANSDPVRVEAVPGTTWNYSGGGTTIIRLVMTDVTGEPFPALMKRLVLDPAGMSHSTYEQPLPAALEPAASAAHLGNGTMIPGRWHVYPELAPDGLWTTPTDLLQWAIEIAASRAGASTKLLSQSMTNQMLTVVKPPTGLGPFLEGTGREFRFGHGGSNAGFQSDLVYFPETGQGAAIMTNGDQGAALIAEIKFAIAAEYGWPGYTPRMVKVIPVDSTALAALTGDYQLDYRGQTLPLSIKLQNGKLIASTPVMGDDEELLPTSATKFVSSVRGMEFAFSGNVLTVTADGAFVLKGPRRE